MKDYVFLGDDRTYVGLGIVRSGSFFWIFDWMWCKGGE